MLKNYIKIALRNLKRNPGYSAINLSGLAIGIASCVLLLSHANYEFSFDKFHKNADRVYRIAATGILASQDYNNAKIPAAMAPLLLNDYPEIENIVRLVPDVLTMFRYEDKKFYEPNFMFADNSIFDVFSFSLIQGDSKTALNAPNTVILTQETAHRYFGDEYPIGKILTYNNDYNLTVTGIIEKPPVTSHLQFNILISSETLYECWPFALESKLFAGSYTYVLLKAGVDAKKIELKLADFFERHASDILENDGDKLACLLQPLTSIHLHSNLQNELPGNTNAMYVYTFIIIAILILLLACINYINLSTALSRARVKEVSMRKAMGASRQQIIKQFFGESLLSGIIAFILGFIFIYLFLPVFINISGPVMSSELLTKSFFWIELAVIMLFVCLIAGAYPAFVLSKFSPVKTLKGAINKGHRKVNFRNTLITFQFSASIALLTITIIVVSQLDYLKNKNLGFDHAHLLSIKIHNDHSDEKNRVIYLQTLRDELVELNGVENATLSSHVPGTRYYQGQFIPEGLPENQSLNMESYQIDDNFLNTFNIDLVKGRCFSKEFTGDANHAVIINETAARRLGWKNPIGKKLTEIWQSERTEYSIIGIVKDFHSRDLHHSIEPLLFFKTDDLHTLTIRLKPENLALTMESIQKKWLEFEPNHPFEYSFLDTIIDSLYKTEIKIGKLIQIFTTLAICIGCLGLLGLISLITQQRTKEIGIRKVLGATEFSMTYFLINGLIKSILIANIIAWPIAYFFMQNWLQNFAYHIHIQWWMFVVSGLVALAIALLTTGIQTFKAASADPVESLRYE